ncbi:hypothetical protein Gocc_1212 [Gaiella occulta]|uniref:Uncharacterized protein n=1 Tax=Gaiella occulta TaxID=1002870 RepID=A0A7M2Z072_9ACTN|nr:hypothetical protein [Gaiella occulta]RDI75414.1 hypothetical protein Gocc_1212 [Gaiella occulta]
MQGQPRRDREWDHWPGRRAPDERLRNRLRGLFAATDGHGTDVEALIAERGREIEERSEQLARTIADLERREEQTARLRAAVEEMLRHGSAELDERHAELTLLARQLGDRDERLAASERELAERRRELGAVELRRAAAERKEAALAEREAALDRIAETLAGRERKLAESERQVADLLARAAQLDARELSLEQLVAETEAARRSLAAAQAALLQRESRLVDLEQRERELALRETQVEAATHDLATREAALAAERDAVSAGRGALTQAVAAVAGGLGIEGMPQAHTEARADTHVLFVPGERYRMVESSGPAPAVGSEIEVDLERFRVVRAGSAPLPGDARSYAYLEPAGTPDPPEA